MLENPSGDSANNTTATIKRYAPPNQRNRSLTRRKSGAAAAGGDRLERMPNNYANDGEKNHVTTSRHVPVSEYGTAVGTNFVSENPHSRLIPLQGCNKSDACILLKDRWTATVNALNDPSIELAERPVMYSGSGASAWGSFRLPHQLMSPTGSSGAQRDFLGELLRAMQDAGATPNT